MAYSRGNQAGNMTRRPLRPCDYIVYHDQQKAEAMQKRLEESLAQGQALQQKTQAANARKRSAEMANMENIQGGYQQQQQQQQQQHPTRSTTMMTSMDPMIADTKKYLELKRRKQAFEDFLLTKRLQKEKAKSDRKMTSLQKEFKQHNQKQQETKEMVAEMMKKQQQQQEKKREGDVAAVLDVK